MRRHNSDVTHHRQNRHETEDMHDIRSQIDMLHQLTTKIDREKKKNRVIIAMIGMLVLVAEITNIVTKLIFRA